MKKENGVRIYEGKLDSISSGQTTEGRMTDYALLEIGDDAPTNVKVINGLDGKLRSSVDQEVKLWIAKKGILVGIQVGDKTYVLSRKTANKGKWGGYILIAMAVLGWLGVVVLSGSLAVMAGVVGFMASLAALPILPLVSAIHGMDNGITEVKKNGGKMIEVSG